MNFRKTPPIQILNKWHFFVIWSSWYLNCRHNIRKRDNDRSWRGKCVWLNTSPIIISQEILSSCPSLLSFIKEEQNRNRKFVPDACYIERDYRCKKIFFSAQHKIAALSFSFHSTTTRSSRTTKITLPPCCSRHKVYNGLE